MSSDNKSVNELLAELFSDPVRVSHEVEGAGVDGHLQDLVILVNQAEGLTIPITLYTPAGVIVGDLISRKQYFELFGQEYRRAFEVAFPKVDWSVLSAMYKLRADPGIDESGDYKAPPQFIHLVNSSRLQDNGERLVAGAGALWRGKVSAVAGFTLGSLGPARGSLR